MALPPPLDSGGEVGKGSSNSSKPTGEGEKSSPTHRDMPGMKRVIGHEHSPPAPQTRTSKDTKETPKVLAPLMTTVTQDNDAHDNSENGGVEYNTCV